MALPTSTSTIAACSSAARSRGPAHPSAAAHGGEYSGFQTAETEIKIALRSIGRGSGCWPLRPDSASAAIAGPPG